MGHVFKKTLGVTLPEHFVRLSYDEAMDLYGSDKPDLRFGMAMQDFNPFVEAGTFQAFKEAIAAGGTVKALVVPGKADYSRKQIEELEAQAKVYKAKGMAWMKVAKAAEGSGATAEGGLALEGGVSKFFTANVAEIVAGLGAKPGDLILLVADAKAKIACTALGAVRSKLGRDLGLLNPNEFKFAWIVDFPMFEYNEEEGRWEAAHHMFTMPQEKYHATLESDPGSVKGDLYDLVLNGYEIASGSIRIHDPELQRRIFKVVGFFRRRSPTQVRLPGGKPSSTAPRPTAA